MILILVALSIATITITLSALAISLAAKALIEVRAMKASTHNIQYVPVDPEIEKSNDDFLAEQEKYNKEYSDELQGSMPLFHKDDEELKIKGL